MSIARRLATPAGLLLALFALLASPGAHASSEPDASLERGKKVYRVHCLECHGKDGRGDGERARRLGFRPRDFTLGSFKCRCTPSGSLPTDEDLLLVVARGLPGTPMKGYEEALSEVDRRSVVEYVKSLSPAFADRPTPRCLEVPAPTAPSDQSVAEGRQVYRLLKCWTCHGVEGRGDGPAAKSLLDDWGYRIRVYNFTRPGRFKCGGEDQDLYRLLHTGLAGSPMPSYSTALVFSRESADNLDGLSGVFSAAELEELGRYLDEQPDSAALRSMTEGESRALRDHRAWALIHFLRSLVAP